MDKDKPINITSASGKGDRHLIKYDTQMLTLDLEYLPKATEVIARNFKEDPAIKYMLCDLPEDERLAYLPTYIHSLLKASALNDGVFQEANDWSCAAIWMPPGKRVDNMWTVIPAGLFGAVWKLGIKGLKVSAQTHVKK
jgi:hypothetical protein